MTKKITCEDLAQYLLVTPNKNFIPEISMMEEKDGSINYELEWYDRGKFVQLYVGGSFGEGIIYANNSNSEYGMKEFEYKPEVLIETLKQFFSFED